eukprot:Pgem_evm2s3164
MVATLKVLGRGILTAAAVQQGVIPSATRPGVPGVPGVGNIGLQYPLITAPSRVDYKPVTAPIWDYKYPAVTPWDYKYPAASATRWDYNWQDSSPPSSSDFHKPDEVYQLRGSVPTKDFHTPNEVPHLRGSVSKTTPELENQLPITENPEPKQILEPKQAQPKPGHTTGGFPFSTAGVRVGAMAAGAAAGSLGEKKEAQQIAQDEEKQNLKAKDAKNDRANFAKGAVAATAFAAVSYGLKSAGKYLFNCKSDSTWICQKKLALCKKMNFPIRLGCRQYMNKIL